MSNSIWQNGHYRPRPDRYKHKKPKSRNPWSPNYEDSQQEETSYFSQPQDYSQGYVNPYMKTPDAPVFDTPSVQDNEATLRSFMDSNKPPHLQNRWKRQPEGFTFSQPIEKCGCEKKQEGFEYDINENANLPHSRGGLGFGGEDFIVKSGKKMPALETLVLQRQRPIWEKRAAEMRDNSAKMMGIKKPFPKLNNEVLYGEILFQSGLRGNYTTFNTALEVVQSYPTTNSFFTKLKQQKEFDVYFFSLNTQGEETISLDNHGFILGLKGRTYLFERAVDYKNQFVNNNSLRYTRYEDIEQSFKNGKKIIAIGLTLDMLNYCENICHKEDSIQEAALYSLTESISHECNLHGLDKLNHNTRDAKKAHQAFFNLAAGSSTSPNPIQLLQGNYGDGSKLAKILLNNLNFSHLKADLISSKIIK